MRRERLRLRYRLRVRVGTKAGTPRLIQPVARRGLWFDAPRADCYNGVRRSQSMKEIKPKYSRILLKLSGEALGGDGGRSINPDAVHDMAEQIREVRDLGVQAVIVLGGGNIFRGLAGSEKGIERATGDYMG